MSKKQGKAGVDENTDQDQWVMFLPDAVKNSSGDATFCKLRHPRTGAGCMFLFTAGNKHIHEVLKFNEKFRSWFINDTVQSDGSISLTTPVDPVFLVLPYLIKLAEAGKFMQLEQIVEDADYPECNRLFSCESLHHVQQVCQVKGADDYKVYRYDEEKTLKWLKAKVNKVAQVLKEKKVQTSSSSSHATTFIVSSKSTGASQEDVMRFAHGVVSEYLPVTLATSLQKYLGIEELVHEKPHIDEPKSKRKKTDITPTTDYSKEGGHMEEKSKTPKMSLAQKQLDKVDKKGMKSISSFFSPKPKK